MGEVFRSGGGNGASGMTIAASIFNELADVTGR